MRLSMTINAVVLVVAGIGTIEIARSANKNEGERAHGAEVFAQWCAPCHAAGPYHPGTQALEAKYMGKLPSALEERRDLTQGVVRSFVRQGVSIMPFFRKTEINDSDLEALSVYLARK